MNFTIRENDRRRLVEAFRHTISDAVKRDGVNMCLIVIPNFLKHAYSDFKKECLGNLSVVSQCVVESTLRKKNLQSIATKLLLQMIAKSGNVLWVPRVNADMKGVMIMAFDNAKGQRSNRLSCCATVNDTFSSVYSKLGSYSENHEKYSEMVKLSF